MGDIVCFVYIYLLTRKIEVLLACLLYIYVNADILTFEHSVEKNNLLMS